MLMRMMVMMMHGIRHRIIVNSITIHTLIVAAAGAAADAATGATAISIIYMIMILIKVMC